MIVLLYIYVLWNMSNISHCAHFVAHLEILAPIYKLTQIPCNISLGTTTCVRHVPYHNDFHDLHNGHVEFEQCLG